MSTANQGDQTVLHLNYVVHQQTWWWDAFCNLYWADLARPILRDSSRFFTFSSGVQTLPRPYIGIETRRLPGAARRIRVGAGAPARSGQIRQSGAGRPRRLHFNSFPGMSSSHGVH